MMESDWIWILLSCKTWITIISVYIFPHQKQAYIYDTKGIRSTIHAPTAVFSTEPGLHQELDRVTGYCTECGDPLALERWTLAVGCRLCGNYNDLATGAQQKQQGKPQQAVFLPYESVNVKTNTAHSTTRGWAWSGRKTRGKKWGNEKVRVKAIE